MALTARLIQMSLYQKGGSGKNVALLFIGISTGTCQIKSVDGFLRYTVPVRLNDFNVLETYKIWRNYEKNIYSCYTGDAFFVNACIQKSYGASHEKSSLVFFSRDITAENVVKLFKATQKNLPGKVAVQQSMGEPDGYLFVEPELSEKLVKQLNGIYINSTGVSDNVSIRKMIAAEHGFMKAGYVDILDEHGQIELPVNGGKILSRNIVGSHIRSYDSLLVLTHFKGHAVSGIGGTMKNLSIGIASPDGKRLIHSGGKNSTAYTHLDQNRFLEANAEAAKSVIDYFKGNVVYISFLYKLAAASDYGAQHPQPVIPDIGILASTDPVALDKACTDMIYSAKGSKPLTDLFEEKNGFHSIEYASELGLGNLEYTLIEINNDIN